MTWVTTVGVDGGQRRATTWMMMWVMMGPMGTMAVTTPATMPTKRMAGTPVGRGGEGAPGRGRGGGGGGSGNGGGGSCILHGSYAFHCEDIFVWYFYDVWGELARSHLPSHSCHA